ncbi:MAG: hypothetical protein IJY08_06190 [Clostridia bacterium]|nr:hypothetical protein [Clostridia bacterium]
MKRTACIILCILFISSLFCVTVSADTGPKPSVHVRLEGLGDEPCYGTLLSKDRSTGPHSAWDGDEAHAEHNENGNYSYSGFDYATWKAFVEYEDSDGYYFLQTGGRVDETGELSWTYYPPSSFKILLYFPESNTFVVSGICERYAFDSYFTVNMADSSAVGGELVAVRSYDYTWELISLAARIVITVIVEMGIALIFGYTAKKQLLLLAGVNTVTQVVLNVMLNLINYRSGHQAFTSNYILLEILIFVIEGAFYFFLLERMAGENKRSPRAIVYALIANAASFASGFAIAGFLPGIF